MCKRVLDFLDNAVANQSSASSNLCWRDVLASQGCLCTCAAFEVCVFYDKGLDSFKRVTTEVFVGMAPLVALAVVGKGFTTVRKVGQVYRCDTVLYNSGM